VIRKTALDFQAWNPEQKLYPFDTGKNYDYNLYENYERQ